MRQTISIAEYRELIKKSPKYGNRKTETNGVKFDSAAEEARYNELLLLETGSAIEGLTLQPSYELQPAFTDARGRKHRPIRYIADFAYIERGRMVVEDVKGGNATKTPVFLLKAKMLAYKFPSIELRIIER